MGKGSNVGLAELSSQTGAVVARLGWSSASGDGDADVSVLLLGADGKVRGDADFYFYNHPAADDGSVQLLGKTPTDSGSEDRIGLDLTATPADVERIVVAASRYGGAGFGDLEDLRLTLADRGGEELLGFSVDGMGEMRAVIFGELYRRDGGWKFRAVGQGYDTGLAGLATDFGIDVDDAEEAEEAEEPREPAAPAAVAPPEPAAPTAPKRPRTARKKVTLPAVARKSLAENDSWHQARLFPCGTLKSDREREMRATSVLLAVMAQVPEYGRRLTAGFGAPAGRMETFTEVSLPFGDTPRRPDGLIRVERAGKLWTALVETKTNGNALRPAQVQDYMDIAARRGYEAVITVSNDVALDGSPLVDVRTDARRKHKVALWHLSWAEVAHQAQMLIRHEGVGNAAHAWLLQELLLYLQHDNSGCHGFQNMGPAWVPVRKGIDEETLCEGDPRAVEVVASWERLIRQVCLRLGGELGQKVLPVQRVKRGTDTGSRRAAQADRLCREGRLQAELRIQDVPGVLALTADLRTGRLRTSIEVQAPEQGQPLTWAKRLVRQLADAPADIHVETLTDGQGSGPRGTLERLRPEPADLLPRDGARITGFRLSLFKGMGSTRGSAETGFIRSVDEAVDRFHASVVTALERRVPLPRKAAPAVRAGAGV
ncbi:TerD family protein [Actinacidiphila bryophytorum]|uniref:TerD family protein n=1 Tax=Actinacidiphila bryophytorum TaxID=1436133 RepID=UPI002176AA82|nr:TerD family protein [Actinacidiphila bryophytorum]UWE13558.1 TerD family protein [Actinacidiphila bryophytorum]